MTIDLRIIKHNQHFRSTAEVHSENVAILGFICRSVDLFLFVRYCLSDLELAAESGYPVVMRHKLLQRQANTLMEMFRFKEAEQKFKEGISAVNESK
jgi:hypothetical protein